MGLPWSIGALGAVAVGIILLDGGLVGNDDGTTKGHRGGVDGVKYKVY